MPSIKGSVRSFCLRKAAQKLHVARKRAARESRTGPDVGARADARIGPQALLDLGGIRADALAQRRDLVRDT